MKLSRRRSLHLALGAAAIPTVSRISWAQSYPARPVHWIVCFSPGGPNDIVARVIGQYLSDHLGQQFIIENRVGAGGNVGMQSALSATPDGYTIVFVGPNNAINATLYERLAFDFIRDSVPRPAARPGRQVCSALSALVRSRSTPASGRCRRPGSHTYARDTAPARRCHSQHRERGCPL